MDPRGSEMGRATSSNCSRSTAIHRRHEPMELEAVGAPQALVKGRPMETHPLSNNDPGSVQAPVCFRSSGIGSLGDSTELCRFGAS